MASMEFPLFLLPVATLPITLENSDTCKYSLGEKESPARSSESCLPVSGIVEAAIQTVRHHIDPRRHARFIRFMSIRIDSLRWGSTTGGWSTLLELWVLPASALATQPSCFSG
ncbi:hypothetical protein ASPCADRAFT_202262 [Aspergillus carbonarius ITEM 5010]|uniref:Uncharacterized protein n=1 Tax=Aspergillus carbonarius (strain ITEM 5010) TaxID=602072 RepID=A0A1R3S0Z0_ASPC5|nr:hypothetical protein ASPCADRAFT_202262 [Aspergillus carbonarius ITEM 5010]